MAITFIAEGSVANVASGNVTPGAPAGTQAGDLLIACIAYRSNAAFTNPTGGEWTTIATQQSSGNTSTTASTAIASGHMAYCIRGESDPNFTFTRTGGNVARAMVFAFRGVDPTTPLDNANVVTEASNTSTPTVSGWTPSRANNLYVQFCAGADNVLSSAWQANGGSGWSSWTEQEDSNTTTGADTNLGVAWATSSAADAITSFQVTKAASSRHVLFAAGFNVQTDFFTGALTLDAATGVSVSASNEATFDQDGVAYLLRDKFSSDLDPLVDANASEGSGVGYRDVTGSGMYAASGRLRGGGASTNLCYKTASGGGGWQRKGGRTFTAIVSPWDGDLDDLYFHLAETAGGIDGYGFRIVGGSSIYAYEPDGTTTLLLQEADNPIKAVRYQLGITLNEGEGAVYWIAAMQDYVVAGTEWDLEAAPDARILWVSQIGTANEYFPTIRNDGAVSESAAWEDVRLLDISGWAGTDGMAIVADRFDRADTTNDNARWDAVDGGGTFGISGNKAYLVSSGGGQNQASLDAGTDDNVILAVKQTTGSSSVGNSGVIMSRVSGTREINLAPYNDASIRMDSINGGYATLATGGPYITTNDTLRWIVMRQGNQYRYWVNGAPTQDIVNPTTDSFQDSPGTYYGISTYAGPDAGVTWDSIAVYPLLLTLPAALQTTALDTPTVGDNLETKAFTDTNGTALTTHDADWSVGAGTWTIQSNRASVSGSGDLYAYLSAGQADYQVTVDVIVGTLGDLRAGLILRRADASNMMRVRLFVDTAQPDNDEIEIETVISGSATVVQKCYLNNYFASAGTYELKCQVEGDVLYVYLDSVLHLVYYIPSSLSSGQGVGLYREGTVDDGATFDDFIVDAIGSTPAETGPLLLTAASGAAVSATSAAFTGQVIASATGAIATSATTEAFAGALTADGTATAAVVASGEALTGALTASAAGSIAVSASGEALAQVAASATSGAAVSASTDALAGALAVSGTGAIAATATTDAFAGALDATATSGVSVVATAGGAGETGPLLLTAAAGAAVSATSEAFAQAAASAAGGIAVSASAEAFTGGLAVSATGNISVSASSAGTYETGPLTLSAASGADVSASGEALSGAISVEADSGVATSAIGGALAGGLVVTVASGAAVSATTEAFAGALSLSAVGVISATGTTATPPTSATAGAFVRPTAAASAFAGIGAAVGTVTRPRGASGARTANTAAAGAIGKNASATGDTEP